MRLIDRLVILLLVPLLILVAYQVNGYNAVVDKISRQAEMVDDESVRAGIEQALQDGLNSLYLLSLTTFLVFILAILFLNALIVRPINEVSAAIDQLTRGKFEVEIGKSDISEIQALIDSFNRIITSLKFAVSKRSDIGGPPPGRRKSG
ncbi:MAG: HAMP domain-containing protein [Candidatus Micrarchaeota archaeon]